MEREVKINFEEVSGPGEILREERIKKGYTLKDVSNETKISPAFLEAIENNKLDRLPGVFFARNFVRTYVRFLQLNEEEILRAFNLLKEEPKENLEKSIKKEGENRFFIASIFLFLFALVFLIIFAFQNQRESTKKEETIKEVSHIHSSYPEVPLNNDNPVKESEFIKILIYAEEDTWIEAELDGKIVLYRLVRKGEKLEFKGKEFVFRVIGRPEGIRVFINDVESIPLGEPGKVARGIYISKRNFESFLKK